METDPRAEGQGLERVEHAVEALDELTAALMEVPQAYEVFVRLSAQEQVGLIEWIDDAVNPRNRRRRIGMICAVLARTGSGTTARDDKIWLDDETR